MLLPPSFSSDLAPPPNFFYFDDAGQPRPNGVGGRGCPEGTRCGFAHPDDPQWPTASGSVPVAVAHLPPPDARLSFAANIAHVPPPPPKTAPPPAPKEPPTSAPAPAPLAAGPSSSVNAAQEVRPREIERIPSGPSAERDRGRDAREKEGEKGKGKDGEGSRSRFPDGSGRAPLREQSIGASSIASSSDPRVRKNSAAMTDRRREDERDLDRDKERARERERERDRERDRDRERERERERRYRDEDRRKDVDRRREDDRRYDERRGRSRDDDYRRRDEDDRRSRQRSVSRSRSRVEVSEEEKRRIWMDRVKTLSESVLARTEHLRLQEDAWTYERLRRSVSYEQLPAEDKEQLDKLVEDTKKALRAKEAEFSKALAKLIPRDFFPYAQPPERQSDAAFREMNALLTSLQNDVKLMYEAVAALQATPIPPAPQEEDRDRDTSGPSSDRPKKRRRLSVEAESSRAQDAPSNPPGPTKEELAQMKDGLTELAGRISNVENDLEQYSSKIDDEVEAQLDYRLPDLVVAPDEDKKTSVELTQDVDKLRGDVEDTEKRAEVVLAALAKLQVDEDGQEDINTQLREQNAKLKQTIEEMEAHQAEMSAKLQAQTLEINALSEAVRAYISQPQHPAPPPPPSAAEIIETVRPPLLTAMHQQMQPLLNESHAHIEQMLKDQLNQVNGALLAQITPTIRAVELVSNWVDKVRAPPPADAAPSSVPTSSS
ncbi:hypothetical protein BD311DRAFT_860259 [Dichomitus squalens]|uniref:C3H1-type domain-containing protein n=1 Tax=Dichomitus squalens TaxID=114155 RepID=A0A4V2K2A1_9APHY|nr:hypothetical protein BD311DRAFT_860259 [Dichomitus squalens]